MDVEDLYARDIAEHAIRPGEIVIEIDNEHLHVVERMEVDESNPFDYTKMKRRRYEQICGNRHQQFPPVDSRGDGLNFIRTRRVLLRDGIDTRFMMDPALREIDFIPGERIHFDPENKIGRITDSCFDPEIPELRGRLFEAFRKMHGRMRPWRPGPYVEVKLNNPFAYWDWAYHLRRILDGDDEHNSGPESHRGCALSGPRLCRPVQNVDLMPSMLEIVMSGKIKRPLPPMSKEMADDFDATHKLSDPENYRPIDRLRGEVILSPWLAGLTEANEAAYV